MSTSIEYPPPPGYKAPAGHQCVVFTEVVSVRKVRIRWWGYRKLPRKRIPDFYVAHLESMFKTRFKLWDLGVQGPHAVHVYDLDGTIGGIFDVEGNKVDPELDPQDRPFYRLEPISGQGGSWELRFADDHCLLKCESQQPAKGRKGRQDDNGFPPPPYPGEEH